MSGGTSYQPIRYRSKFVSEGEGTAANPNWLLPWL
jgi:hypothetical protein